MGTIMRAMRAEGFSGYKDLRLVDIPKPAVSDGRVLVRITAAGVTPLEHTILSGGYRDRCNGRRNPERSSGHTLYRGKFDYIGLRRRPQGNHRRHGSYLEAR